MNVAVTMLLAQLINAREEAGVTQHALAMKIRAGVASVKAWEGGHALPRIDRFVAYADALGYDVTLVAREGDAAPVTGRRHVIRRRTYKRREGA